MQIIYTNHAEENILERKMSKKIVEDVIKNPEKVIDTRFGRKIAQRIIDNKLLRVIYDQVNNTYIVVTAYYTTPERYGEDI